MLDNYALSGLLKDEKKIPLHILFINSLLGIALNCYRLSFPENWDFSPVQLFGTFCENCRLLFHVKQGGVLYYHSRLFK